MNVLELFSGSKMFSNSAKELGHMVLSVDKFIESDLKIGIEEVTKEGIENNLGVPDLIWASPVCSAWSKTGWFHYWNSTIYSRSRKFLPKHPFAAESIEMVRKTIEIFSWFPNSIFFMENPEGLLYRHPVINNFSRYNLEIIRHNITYCQYGDTVRKPTHIWTNSNVWRPRKPCKNGDFCHIEAPRGTQKGTRSKRNSFNRSIIPKDLCFEILKCHESIAI